MQSHPPFLIVAALSCLVRAAGGQAVLRGMVLADSGAQPVSGAVVELLQLPRTTTTDAAGSFTLANLPPGKHGVRVRHIGFAPSVHDVDLVAHDTVRLVVRLKPAPVELTAVNVSEASPEAYNPLMTGFAERRRFNSGQFLGPAELYAQRNTTFETVIRKLGVNVRLTKCPEFRPCGLRYAQGRRGPSSLKLNDYCPIQIFLDGMMLPSPVDLRTIKIETLAGVESYGGGAQTPVVYERGDAMCGVMVLWTRTREP